MNSDTGLVRASTIAVESAASAVTWSAILAGAFVAGAVSLALLILGSALGLASVSPWSGAGASAGAITVGAAVWLIVTQWIASGLGGYLTGRLRTKWVGVHTNEVFFRDTTHGLLAWAVATIFMAALFASTAASILGTSMQAVTSVASGAAQGAAQGATTGASGDDVSAWLDPTSYYVDRLFRAPSPAGPLATSTDAAAETPTTANAAASDTASAGAVVVAPAADAGATSGGSTGSAVGASESDGTVGTGNTTSNDGARVRAESARILARNLTTTEVDATDRTYLAQLVAQQTGLHQAAAEQRVDEVLSQAQTAVTQAQQMADAARRAGAKFSLYFFLSLLIGAFIGSAAAAYGGMERDERDVIVRTP